MALLLDPRIVVCLVGSSFCGLVVWILVLWVVWLNPGFFMLVGWILLFWVGCLDPSFRVG